MFFDIIYALDKKKLRILNMTKRGVKY